MVWEGLHSRILFYVYLDLFSFSLALKGRVADGGHYMGWVRQDGDDWLLFDDDGVSPCKTENVMQLKGGGDSDMAYLIFYRYHC